MHHCLHEGEPAYLAECVRRTFDDTRGLMAPSRFWYRQWDVPHSEDRAFPVAAARAWNALPTRVRSEPSLSIFHRQLKTYLFHVSFPEQSITKPITVILIWSFMHFYHILYRFHIFVQWSCSNCDSVTLKIHFCDNNNSNNNCKILGTPTHSVPCNNQPKWLTLTLTISLTLAKLVVACYWMCGVSREH